MQFAADCMHSISKFLGKENEIGKEYGLTARLLSDFELLNKMHFDYTHGAYFDYGNHTEQVRLSWQLMKRADDYPIHELVQEVSEEPVLRLVPHIGYVSLFPFMVDGPYRERAKIVYTDLRDNLIRNVVRNYNQTGYLWEQYDQKKGKGKGARLFTGWTSLVLLIQGCVKYLVPAFGMIFYVSTSSSNLVSGMMDETIVLFILLLFR